MTLESMFTVVKKALKGEERDYTEGHISEAVVLLSIPMILELSLESVFAVVDMFFVSKLGQNAIATVGLTEAVVTLIYSIAIGISTGATAIVARRVGEKNPDAAAHAAAQTLTIGFLVSLVLGILGVVYAKQLLQLMGASHDVVADGTSFAQIMLGGSVVIILLFLINGIFRGAGNAAMAMKSLWLASALNILLCPLFIHFFGLKGAAIATVVGRGSGIFYQLLHLFKGDGTIRLKPQHFGLDLTVVKSVLKVAWPATFQFLLGSGSWIILTRIVAETGGTAASAGYQIAFRNFAFFILPAWGLSNAAATLVGQNLGAGKADRAEQSVFVTAKYSAVLMSFVTVFFLLLAEPIIKIYSQEPEVLAHGTRALQIMGSGFIFYGIAMVMTQALNGAGDTATPTWINVFCFWVFQTPLAYFLAKGADFQAAGAVAAIPITEALLACVAWYFFKKGRWKNVKV